MEKEIAEHIVDVAFRSASSLNDLLPLLKQHCEAGEYQRLLKGIATATFGIEAEVLSQVYEQFPVLKDELDAKIAKYGRLI